MAEIVLGVIGSDAHVVGITILEHALEDAGHEVHNLGVQTPQSEFVEAAAEHDADAVLVSSLYGHARRDCDGLHEELTAAGLDPATYVGGNLSVGQEEFDEVRQRFRAMGFDRVFEPGTPPEVAISTLQEDLEETASVPEHVVVEQ
jgi:methylaspartate mutase sigma subunit